MNLKLTPLFALAGLALASTGIQAESLVEGSAEAGKARALTCTACHGPEGNSVSPMWPNIAGQNAPYLLAQLQAFKDGSRSDPLMSGQAMMLSDDDIANLAVYFESLHAAVQAVADTARPFNAVYRAIIGEPLAWPGVTLSDGEFARVDPLSHPHLLWRPDVDDRYRANELYWAAWNLSRCQTGAGSG